MIRHLLPAHCHFHLEGVSSWHRVSKYLAPSSAKLNLLRPPTAPETAPVLLTVTKMATSVHAVDFLKTENSTGHLLFMDRKMSKRNKNEVFHLDFGIQLLSHPICYWLTRNLCPWQGLRGSTLASAEFDIVSTSPIRCFGSFISYDSKSFPVSLHTGKVEAWNFSEVYLQDILVV